MMENEAGSSRALSGAEPVVESAAASEGGLSPLVESAAAGGVQGISPCLNGLVLNERSGRVTIAAGATGYFRVDIETNGGTLAAGTDKAVFAVGEKKSWEPVFRKDYDIAADGAGGYYMLIELANEDTRGLEPGKYCWTVIVVTDPALDGDGNVVVDERSDGVYPLWQGAQQPEFIVEGIVHVV